MSEATLGGPRWQTLPQPAPMPKPDEAGNAPVNGIRMHYAIFNRSGGDPVILLHGGMGNSDHWGNQVPALMMRHKVIVADSRGQGRSTRTPEPLGYRLMAGDALALLDRLDIAKTAVVGWSDGAITGLEIAISAPHRISLPAFLKHLRTLERAGLVLGRKTGRVRRCRLVAAPLGRATDWLTDYRAFWEGRLDSLERYFRTPQENDPWTPPPPEPAKPRRSSSAAPSPRRARKSSKRGPTRK